MPVWAHKHDMQQQVLGTSVAGCTWHGHISPECTTVLVSDPSWLMAPPWQLVCQGNVVAGMPALQCNASTSSARHS